MFLNIMSSCFSTSFSKFFEIEKIFGRAKGLNPVGGNSASIGAWHVQPSVIWQQGMRLNKNTGT